jgi:hypothetical protein
MSLFRTPLLTPLRIWPAFAVAIAADGFQLLLGPLGWTFLDEITDVVTMIVLSLMLGFHPLFLPTFLVEIIPVVDMLPTWTGCVAVVVAMRKREQRAVMQQPASTPPKVIDI